ncbi:hypothetical protein WJX74_010885 [Apatococcus lobatus]|uniref:sulfiredoxin n=1 Tax=Apatococcus lobatus TaxID=904363 RepID=A0AAW1SHF2_9CHLO
MHFNTGQFLGNMTRDEAFVTVGRGRSSRLFCKAGASEASQKYGWDFSSPSHISSLKASRQIKEVPVNKIRRPLGRTRSNDQEKVEALMDSIQEIGLKEPIDVLEVDGEIYGFSGCHRFEAHQKLGKQLILCRIRKANQQVLRMHMM